MVNEPMLSSATPIPMPFASDGSARGEPTEKARERRGADREAAASVTDVVEDEDDPAAAGVLRTHHVVLEVGESVRADDPIDRLDGVRVRRREGLRRSAETAEVAARVVATVLDDLF